MILLHKKFITIIGILSHKCHHDLIIMSKENWDVKYSHNRNKLQNRNPYKKKTLWVTIACIAGLIIGLTVAEQIAFSVTFPKSSNVVEIDGVDIRLKTRIVIQKFQWHVWITVYLEHDMDMGFFPPNVTADQIWVIPKVGRLWAWRNYLLASLEFSGFSFSRPEYLLNTTENLSKIKFLEGSDTADIIVSLKGSDNQMYYVHQNDVHIVISNIW